MTSTGMNDLVLPGDEKRDITLFSGYTRTGGFVNDPQLMASNSARKAFRADGFVGGELRSAFFILRAA
jgi:hypothetical protein